MKRQRENTLGQVEPKKQKMNNTLEQQSYPFEMRDKILQILKSEDLEDVSALKAALSEMEKLDLRNNYIEDAEGAAIGEALKSNSALTQLDLRNNKIGKAGSTAIGEALKSNSTLAQLDLSYNYIGEVEGAAIGDSLRSNSTLTQLNLSDNEIRDAGGVAIGEALKNNSTLTQLNLSGNEIRDAGGVAIGEALKSNSTLTRLDLWNNKIGTERITEINNHLKINLHIKHAKEELTLKYLFMRELIVQQEELTDPLSAAIPQIHLDIINAIFIQCIYILGDTSGDTLDCF